MQKEEPIKNILRVAQILSVMAEGQSRLTKIAGKLQISSSTIHRLLKSMEKAGFAVQDPLDGGYFIGPLFCKLMQSPNTNHQLLSICALEEMEKLAEETGETVGLVVRLGLKRFLIEEIISPQAVSYSVGKGYISPLSAGASSRVLLSQLSPPELDKILSFLDYPSITSETITHRSELEAKIEQARSRGYAMSFGEYFPGASSVAVPIYGYTQPASLCLLGPVSRLNKVAAKRVLPLLLEAVKKIKQNLEKLN